MSTLATARALPRSTTSRPSRERELKVVTASGSQGYGGLMATCLAVLVLGLLGVLMLNISMAKGAFALSDLQGQSNELSDSSSALSHAIDAQSAPAELARQALALGMVPASNAAFLRLSDGKVLGVAAAAKDSPSFTVVADGTSGSAPTAGTSPSAAPSAGAVTPGTTVTRQGTVTTTTVVVVRGKQVETTVTSVDSANGKTSSTTTTSPAPAAPTTPSPAASPSPSN